jgi:hypothetical protein
VIFYTLSSAKLEIRWEQILPESVEGWEGEGGAEVEGRNGPVYAHMNK